MSFQCRCGWHCQFQEADLKTPLAQEGVPESDGGTIRQLEDHLMYSSAGQNG
jgi:hypothetical protein